MPKSINNDEIKYSFCQRIIMKLKSLSCKSKCSNCCDKEEIIIIDDKKIEPYIIHYLDGLEKK